MEFELKDGEYVQFIMESGRDLVMGAMKKAEAEELVRNVEVTKSEFSAFPIKAGVFRFKGKIAEEPKPSKKAKSK